MGTASALLASGSLVLIQHDLSASAGMRPIMSATSLAVLFTATLTG